MYSSPGIGYRPQRMSGNDPEQDVDRSNLTVTSDRPSRVSVIPGASGDESIVVVSEVYGPAGDNLVGLREVKFSGFPAVTVGIRVGEGQGEVHLSPIHGDRRKAGFTDIEPGTKVELFCPVSGRPLDRVGEVEDGSGASYYALYLSPKLSPASMVMVSDVWDHFHSRIVDDDEVISYWAATHDPD
jgi:hypothetical protein